jgi:hypothetical protein
MANGTTAAVDQAARLNEIGFPEFTAKLITDTFDALVSANLRQTQSYIDLLQAVAKSLTAFINDTKDDIGGAELLQFLATVVPATDSTSNEPKVKVGETLNGTEASALNTALAVPEASVTNVAVADSSGPITEAKFKAILDAVAIRIAANKYILLQEMVKQGILRLVVETGVIETRLTFTTYGSTFYQKNADMFHRDEFKVSAQARTGRALAMWVKASAAASYTSVNIRTTNETQRDISGSSVQIFGRVQINFKTDYLPLAG